MGRVMNKKLLESLDSLDNYIAEAKISKDEYLKIMANDSWETGTPFDIDDFDEFKKIGKDDGYNLTNKDFDTYFEYYDEARSGLTEDVCYSDYGLKCPKCGSGKYHTVDDEETEYTKTYHHECEDCGYVGDSGEIDLDDLDEAENKYTFDDVYVSCRKTGQNEGLLGVAFVKDPESDKTFNVEISYIDGEYRATSGFYPDPRLVEIMKNIYGDQIDNFAKDVVKKEDIKVKGLNEAARVYDDEKDYSRELGEVFNGIADFVNGAFKNSNKDYLEYGFGNPDRDRADRSKIFNGISRQLSDEGFLISRDRVQHAHGIGNNNGYEIFKGNECIGFLNLNSGIYGGEVYVYLEDLKGNRVGGSWELRSASEWNLKNNRVVIFKESEKLKEGEEVSQGMTLYDYIVNVCKGEIDMDVSDKDIDMMVAFCHNVNDDGGEYPEMARFLNVLAKKTKIVKQMNGGYAPVLVCDFSSALKPYNEEWKEIFDMDYSEFDEDEAYYEAVANLEPLISGNAGEGTYKKIADVLEGKKINESDDSSDGEVDKVLKMSVKELYDYDKGHTYKNSDLADYVRNRLLYYETGLAKHKDAYEKALNALREDEAIDGDPDLDREQVNADVDYWTDMDNADSGYYYKEFSGAGEIDYVEFDDEWEAHNYAEKVNKKTGHETAVYKMSNDECVELFDAFKLKESEHRPLSKEKYFNLIDAVEDIVYSISLNDDEQFNDLVNDCVAEFHRCRKQQREGSSVNESEKLVELDLDQAREKCESVVSTFEGSSKTTDDFTKALNEISRLEWENEITTDLYDEYIAKIKEMFKARKEVK